MFQEIRVVQLVHCWVCTQLSELFHSLFDSKPLKLSPCPEDMEDGTLWLFAFPLGIQCLRVSFLQQFQDLISASENTVAQFLVFIRNERVVVKLLNVLSAQVRT